MARTLIAARNAAVGTTLGYGLCLAVDAPVPGLAAGCGTAWAVAAALAGGLLASVHTEAQRTAHLAAALDAPPDAVHQRETTP